MKLKLLILALACAAGNIFAQSDTLFVHKTDNTVIKYAVSSIDFLCFDPQYLVGVKDDVARETGVKEFFHSQNFPNPFNPSTNIEFYVPSAGNIQLKIFNINGEVMKQFNFVNEPEGSKRITWNGKDEFNNSVASGVYFYQVIFNANVLTKKMIYLK